MVRTKVARKATGRKHARNSTDPKQQMEESLRELETYASTFETDLELQYRETCDALQAKFNKIRNGIPKSLLQKTIGEVKELDVKTFAEVTLLTDKNLTNLTTTTASSNLSTILEKSYRNKSKDDGYITEELTADEMSDQGTLKKNKRLGPLASARARRSKSATSSYTPFLTAQKTAKTPMIGLNADLFNSTKPNSTITSGTDRLSRSKMRTPLNNRVKAASADRSYLITPKVNPSFPLAILRHAKAGEAVFSVTGSPVITSTIVENTANVNIPVANGVLSIRPTEMRNVDSRVVDRLDLATLTELKQLQSNLNMLISLAGKK